MSSPLPAILPLLAVLPPLLALFVPATLANRFPLAAGRLAGAAMLLSLGLALVAALELAVLGRPVHHEFLAVGPAALTVYFDVVTAIMLVLVAFLGAAVTAFSRHYLAGDAHQGRFFKGLALTVGSVLLLIVSGNLAMFTLAWIATSLSLHQLLTFYPDRPAALLAARKKYVFSRLGDLCLLAALFVAWQQFGTLDYAKLFAEAADGVGAGLPTLGFLLVAGAILKSAQFPFHGWLPDTMETPTPVSALMHAGIINAGGFLVIRFSPLVTLSPAALDLLAAVGAITALFGSVVMITQTSIKRTLAFSTVAQMGFMMLQCGLGAFALALLHIVAHSLYKAHAFLSSGGVIAQMRAAGSPPARLHPGLPGVLGAFAVAVLLVLAVTLPLGAAPWGDPARFALSFILAIALAQLLWNWWTLAGGAASLFAGVAVALGVCVLSFGLHAGAQWLVNGSVAAAPSSAVLWPIAILTPLAFLLVAARVFLPPSWVSTRLGRALFVHAYNGFYVNTFANRLLHALRLSKSA